MSYASDKKPGELTALTSLATDDVFVVGDTSDASEVAKGITKANLITDLTTSFATAGHNHTGVYAPVLGADDNYVTDAEKTKLSNLSGTNSGDNAVNSNYSGLVTNATHTGEVTGSGALTLDKTAISNKADTVITASDVILFGDATDTGNLKSDTVQGILDLIPGGGNVSKVGTPVNNQIGVWTGDGTIEGDATLTWDGVADTLSINASTANYPLVVERSSDLTAGPFIKTKQITASPAAGDYIGGVDLYSSDSAANEQAYAFFNAKIVSPTSGAEYGSFVIETIRNGVLGTSGKQMLEVGAESDGAINGISVGFDDAAGIVSSRGNNDLTLQTGNATTGNITITDGADGKISLTPNGTGAVEVSTTLELGHASDTTLSRVSAGVVAVEGVNLVKENSNASAAEINTGTSTTKFNTPDALAGSYAGTKSLSVQVTDGGTDVAVGDGKAYITIPEALNGMNLVRAQATVVTAGTTNATTVMIHNKTDAQDMLSGAISIASGGTVGTVGTVNGTYDDVATNDVLRIDVDSVSTTAPKGLMCVLEFRLP